jgi:hypothetical protein
MTTTLEKQKEEIRAACIASNPEIVELKFGCDIRFALTEGGGSLATVLFRYDGDYVTASYAKFHNNKAGMVSRHLNKIEIIGRPIRLSDVLLALKEYTDASDTGKRINTERIVKRWNLRTDDLEAQSSETLSFIHSLICPKQ